jgi:hypothetical protein
MSGHRWQFMLRPRWLAWHLFAVVATVGMLWLGDWQLHRAEAGNELSWAYTIEWPLFVICGVYFYIRTIREELDLTDKARQATGSAEASASTFGSASTVGSASTGESAAEQEPETADAYLARLRAEVGSHGRWHGWR